MGHVYLKKRDLKILALGFELLKKPNKNEFEKKAARSFLLIICSTLFFIGVLMIALIFTVLVKPEPAHSTKRGGTVEGDKVRYVQNTLKYVTLEELDIDLNSVEDGDRLELYFDSHDSLIGAELQKIVQERSRRNGIMFIVSFIVCLVLMLVVPNLVGKPWRQYFKNYYEPNYSYQNQTFQGYNAQGYNSQGYSPQGYNSQVFNSQGYIKNQGMDIPRYVLRTNQNISVEKFQLFGTIQSILMMITFFIVGAWILKFPLVRLISWQIRIGIIAISTIIFIIPNKKTILSPFEIQFYNDYLIIYHERYHVPPSIKQFEKVFYRDIERCQYSRKEKKIEIFCVVQRKYYLEEGKGRYSEPRYIPPKRDICVFYTNVEPIIDFVQEIQRHSPIKVVVID